MKNSFLRGSRPLKGYNLVNTYYIWKKMILMVKNCCKRNSRLAAFLCSYKVSKDFEASAELSALLTLRSCKFFMCNQIHDDAVLSRSSHYATFNYFWTFESPKVIQNIGRFIKTWEDSHKHREISRCHHSPKFNE